MEIMKDKIKQNVENPEQLERLFRLDSTKFKNAFYEIYDDLSNFKFSAFWKARLDYENSKVIITKNDILLLIFSCFIAGFLIKIPQILDFNFEQFLFYERNFGLIAFFGLSVYSMLTKEKLHKSQIIFTFSVFLISLVFINFLPSKINSSSVILSFIHLPLMFWALYGLVFIDFDIKDKPKRIDFIKYNGDLVILGGIILIAGGILTGITIGLFSAIQLDIRKFYMDYIVVWGLVSAPIVATFIIKKYPTSTNKIAAIISNIFSPLVLITLVFYLISILVTGKNLYTDRDFLIVFNFLLLGVMALIVFSIAEISLNKKQRINVLVLLLLSAITLMVDIIALSAIIYRLGEYGFTPNRIVVLGSNLLIFGNLILIMIDLVGANLNRKSIKQVEMTIANYLPIYVIWTIFVVFVLPFIFSFN